jgi:hypothetical protein
MRTLIGGLVLLLAWPTHAEDLLAKVQSRAYQSTPIPASWIPEVRAATITSAREYPRASVRSIEIAAFVKVYGVPSRLLTPRSGTGYSYLVYDLADGYKMVVYVLSPKGSTYAAAQLFRPNGEAEGPILK